MPPLCFLHVSQSVVIYTVSSIESEKSSFESENSSIESEKLKMQLLLLFLTTDLNFRFPFRTNGCYCWLQLHGCIHRDASYLYVRVYCLFGMVCYIEPFLLLYSQLGARYIRLFMSSLKHALPSSESGRGGHAS